MPNTNRRSRRRKPPEPCIGPRYTAQDELDISRAIASAKRYMLTYGRDSTPTPIDKSHYIQPIDNHDIPS